ncbi:hypothetical protein [Sphaerospermopsis torques-reginae]|uniref:Uncharacterized protein n=1 Tax=Sphaerospermopsis torques-reginae ITEP-024 TaxID=984208 RepID=A0ABX8X2V4_9CYAN|nr:hypothetical protein [Sphaerospermopsis torques-reginae]QYX33019.1 hypothetical protein K2F26_06670 [Sphaerospermopsis torques-reginae ITEP-024]
MTLALTGNAAMAQSSESLLVESSDSSMGTAAEIKMSPEGMEILCQRFPLNSRCPGGIPLDRNFLSPVSSPETNLQTNPETNPETNLQTNPETNSIESNTDLNTTTVPVTPTSPNPDNSNQLTPVPESSPVTEFSSPEQVPVNILPQTAPSGT